ncbi:MAG: hypothetical protein CL853_08030 [Crocinitomicaceae bacterium]|nr:hypothetical protein [Crocinitomicaceae bacterium]|tara:strand:- start:10814 stop:11413 length:600 start_codon:yes stop_codon:yes gene_type:complete
MKSQDNSIGLFPLRIFLLPGEQTTLHIYEPRYLQLINECYKSKNYFGIPFQGKTTLSEYGSLVKIVQILKNYENGELDILVECCQNFKINQFEAKKENKLYPSGTIALIKDIVFNPDKTLLNQVTLYLKLLLDKDISRDMSDLLSEKNIINVVNLTDDEKIKFLRYNNDKKNEFLNRKIKFMLILLRQEKKVEQNFYLN